MPNTTSDMAKRYVHIGSDAHREAVAALDPGETNEGGQSRTSNSDASRHSGINATDFSIKTVFSANERCK